MRLKAGFKVPLGGFRGKNIDYKFILKNTLWII
jgi:hypothetical protein